MSEPKKVGLVGVGIMGTAIATRILECGHSLTVYDRNTDNVNAMVEKGAVAGTSAADVTAKSDFIIMSLNKANIVEIVVFGQDGIAESGSADKLLIDMSSIDPEATQQMSARLLEQTGMPWVDCPLSGGAPGAYAGKLTIMAGGTQKDFDKSREVMDSLAANMTLMGPSGAGQTTKLVNQVLCAITFQGIAEATQLALNGGVDIEKVPACLAGGRADSALLQEFMVKMGRKDYSPTGRIDNMLKDLESVQMFAMKTQTMMPITTLTTEINRMFCAAGKGDNDSAALMKQFNGPADE